MAGAFTGTKDRTSTAEIPGGGNAIKGIALARQRLIHGHLDEPDFEHDLNLMFVRNELAAQGTLLLLAVIFSLASMFWAHWTQALIWLALVIGAKVLLLELCRRYQATPGRRDRTSTSGANACCWPRRPTARPGPASRWSASG